MKNERKQTFNKEFDGACPKCGISKIILIERVFHDSSPDEKGYTKATDHFVSVCCNINWSEPADFNWIK